MNLTWLTAVSLTRTLLKPDVSLTQSQREAVDLRKGAPFVYQQRRSQVSAVGTVTSQVRQYHRQWYLKSKKTGELRVGYAAILPWLLLRVWRSTTAVPLAYIVVCLVDYVAYPPTVCCYVTTPSRQHRTTNCNTAASII